MSLQGYMMPEVYEAFRAWVLAANGVAPKHKHKARDKAWWHYCDLRDNVEPGTSEQRYRSIRDDHEIEPVRRLAS